MDAFDALQKKLVKMWEMIGSSIADHYEENHSLVVIPSITVDIELASSAQQAYEERMLFLLFLLRKPEIRLIYISSLPIHEKIINYYLELIPGVISTHARKRLFLLSPEDGSARPLSQKVLDRPHLIKQIRMLVRDFNRAHIVPFNTTDLERELALKIGLPMYAADPRFYAFGTKSGCRHIFESENILHPMGEEDLFTEQALIQAIMRMRAKRPIQQVVVKLNEGVSGLGNATVDLRGLPASGAANEGTAIQTTLHALNFSEAESTYADYLDKLIAHGAIVEEFITGTEVHSPSVQLRLTPLGQVEVLSTHDQMLGGASGQNYLGAIFPAKPAYSQLIVKDAYKIGERLAKEGILGRFAIDFVVLKQADGSWLSYAIEINLRKGGTTAPFLILQYLTDGLYDTETGIFHTAHGQAKYYIASDHVDSPSFHSLTVDDLMDIVSTHRLHYNHASQTGIIMHMMTGVGELGRIGMTAIDNSPEAAQALYQEAFLVLEREAQKLLQEPSGI